MPDSRELVRDSQRDGCGPQAVLRWRFWASQKVLRQVPLCPKDSYLNNWCIYESHLSAFSNSYDKFSYDKVQRFVKRWTFDLSFPPNVFKSEDKVKKEVKNWKTNVTLYNIMGPAWCVWESVRLPCSEGDSSQCTCPPSENSTNCWTFSLDRWRYVQILSRHRRTVHRHGVNVLGRPHAPRSCDLSSYL